MIRNSMRPYLSSIKSATLYDLVRHSTSLTILQHWLRSTEHPYSTNRLRTRGGNRSDRKETRKSITLANFNEGFPSSSLTQSSPATLLSFLTLKVPHSSTSDPPAPSSTTSADNAPFCCLSLSTTLLVSRCNLVLEQLLTLPIHQHSARLRGLPSSGPNQPRRPWQKSFRSPLGREQSLPYQ